MRDDRFSHVAPSFDDFHTLPSSVPAYSRPGLAGLSSSATIVPYVSAPVASSVMPPVRRSAVSSLAVRFFDRSGEMMRRSSPRLVDFSTLLPAKYTTDGLCGERKNGAFQL